LRDLPYLHQSRRTRHHRGRQFPLLSIDDAQALFAKLWKVYGVGIGQIGRTRAWWRRAIRAA
jgi:hypothetical protein